MGNGQSAIEALSHIFYLLPIAYYLLPVFYEMRTGDSRMGARGHILF